MARTTPSPSSKSSKTHSAATRSRRSREPEHQPKSLGSLLVFWPFHLFHFVIRNYSTPIRFLLRLIGDPAIAGLYVLVFLSIVYGLRSKQYELGKIHEMPERSIILDRRGTELARLHGEIRDIISLDQVAPDFRKAILAREDERFYQHGAFDPIGIVRAFLKNLQGKREAHLPSPNSSPRMFSSSSAMAKRKASGNRSTASFWKSPSPTASSPISAPKIKC